MSLRKPLASRVAIGVMAAVVLLAIVLFVTHGIWFDNPSESVARRMDIIGQLLVGIGTAALAVVTWTSVYETQQSLADEDLRFRRGRMPMLKLKATPSIDRYNINPSYTIEVYNVGDGAARNVRLSFSAHVVVAWNKDGLAGERENFIERDFSGNNELVSAYLPPSESIIVTFEGASEIITQQNALTHNDVETAVLKYDDVFGEEFETRYHPTKERPFDTEDFAWKTPAALRLGALKTPSAQVRGSRASMTIPQVDPSEAFLNE